MSEPHTGTQTPLSSVTFESTIEVALIAPVRAYRDALDLAMRAERGFRLVSFASSGPEAIACMSPVHPTVALLDFNIDDVVAVLGSLRRAAPSTHLIGIGVGRSTSHTAAVVEAAEAGVTGFVDADQPVSDIAAAIRLAVRGESPCSPRIAALLLQALRRRPAPPAVPFVGAMSPAIVLTSRERVVAELVARGLSNRQIAAHLVLGESTVKSHVHSILGKLGLHSREEVLAPAAFAMSGAFRMEATSSGGGKMETAPHPAGSAADP